MSPDSYRYAGGSICPACEGRALAWGMFFPGTPATVHQEIECRRCRATWQAVYTLMGYTELTPLPEDTP